jgi:hypothetical protein
MTKEIRTVTGGEMEELVMKGTKYDMGKTEEDIKGRET